MAEAHLCKAWFLRHVLCRGADAVLRIVPGIRVRETKQAVLSEAPCVVLELLAKCPMSKCLNSLPGYFDGTTTSEQQRARHEL